MDVAILITPILAIIILGWICSATKYVDESLSFTLVQFVLKIAAPALMFLVLSNTPLREIFNWEYIAIFGGSALAFFVVVFFVVLAMKKSISSAGIYALAVGQSSASFVALPILLIIFGHRAVVPVAISVFLLVVIMLPIGILLVEIGCSENISSMKKSLPNLAGKVFKNPVVLWSILGVLYSSFHFPLPHLAEVFIRVLADAVTPCALFAVGLNIKLKNLSGEWKPLVSVIFLKLIALPAAVFGLSLLFHFKPIYAIPAILISSVPIAKIVYIEATSYLVEEQFIATATGIAELISIVTMMLWIILMVHVYPQTFAFLKSGAHDTASQCIYPVWHLRHCFSIV